MGMNKTAGLVAGALLVGLAIPSLASSTTDAGQQITACVDWQTKEIKYSKNWTKCPAKTSPLTLGAIGPAGPKGEAGPAGPQGLMGPAGPSGNAGSGVSAKDAWDSMEDCNQKLNLALAAGYLMATKRDRSNFEKDTGCLVERVFPTFRNSVYQNMNLPYIARWEFVSFNGVTEGEGAFGVYYYGAGLARYEVTVTGLPEGYVFCEIAPEDKNVSSFFVETTPDGKAVIDTYLRASHSRFYAQIEIGITSDPDLGCFSWGYPESAWVEIHEDPARFIDTEHFQEHLEWWGWN